MYKLCNVDGCQYERIKFNTPREKKRQNNSFLCENIFSLNILFIRKYIYLAASIVFYPAIIIIIASAAVVVVDKVTNLTL